MEIITIHIEDNSKEVLDALKNAVERGLMAVGEQAATHAKDNITAQGAVDTGRLRNSITYSLKGHDGKTLRYTQAMQKAGKEAVEEPVSVYTEDTVYIGSNVFYGPFIELGTVKMKARPFLKPAVSDHSKEYFDLLRESLRNA